MAITTYILNSIHFLFTHSTQLVVLMFLDYQFIVDLKHQQHHLHLNSTYLLLDPSLPSSLISAA